MHVDTLWSNVHLITLDGDGLGVIRDGVLACADGRIVHVGTAGSDAHLQPTTRIDGEGRWISPGLIDCHTHLVYAGNRANEFEQRLQGVSYAEIARAGGGIVSTVRATRAATPEQLARESRPRLLAMRAEGVTTLEIKSGYGLTLPDERKQLQVARALGEECRVNVVTTFLGAHAIPPGREAEEYTDEVCNVMIPTIAAEGLAEAVDVICENIAFSPAQTRQVFEAARAHGLAVKIHAEQLSNQHGAELAAGFGALSADHIEHLDDAGIAAMAAAGTVAVLLPGACYFTRDTTLPPIAALRAAGVPLALATDSNPGTSPLTSPLLAMNMGATLFRLTVDECIAGFTREAARALGHGDRIGRLAVGMDCDLAIWDIDAPADLVYRIGFNPLHARWRQVYRGSPLALDPAALPVVRASAAAVAAIVAKGAPVYGINTGFGKLASVRIEREDLATLQRNIVLSHAAGVGEPMPASVVRLMMALKLVSLAQGASGIREDTLRLLEAMLVKGVLPVVPAQGSVGASGDLAPLSHLASVMLGVGEAFIGDERLPAVDALARAGLQPIELGAKEGLALLNGTQFSTAYALAGLFEIETVFQAALVTGALSVEAAKGSDTPSPPRPRCER
ncbi:hypothetical protein G6F65_013475 [Rhizopus arrhizus]|nr:hypothetical protein G6F65_013475 [Rhizopus arrhizus]